MLVALACIPLLSFPDAIRGGALLVAPLQASQTVLEGIDTSVTFRVTNNTGQDLVLDYALTIIQGPPFDKKDPDGGDNVFFKSVTFPTVIKNGDFGDFIYGLRDPNDPFDGPDDGLNNITFQVGMSPWDEKGTPAINTAVGLGNFIFDTNGVGSTGALNAGVLAQLEACDAAPATSPNPCTNGDLYGGEFHGQPFPALATVNVVDVPEPASFEYLLIAASGLVGIGRRGKNGR